MPFNFLFLKTYLTHTGALMGSGPSGNDGRVLRAGGGGFLLVGWRQVDAEGRPQSSRAVTTVISHLPPHI